MNILNIEPGSDKWKNIRFDYLCASEAPVMTGDHPHMSRDDLLAYKTTKIEKDVSRFTQYIFDKGHRLEEMARPIAEDYLGVELYPSVGVREYHTNDYTLNLLSSFDGLSLCQKHIFEHKQWNEKKAISIMDNYGLEPLHYWQLEHQALVAGLKSVLFVMSDGTRENWLPFKYDSNPNLRKELIKGWVMFMKDLEGYQPKTYVAKPVAAPVKELPAITYQLNGLALTSNLDQYRTAAEKLVDDSRKPMSTDQDFADRELLVKKFREAEKTISLIQDQVIGEVSDIDEFRKDLGHIGDLLRQARLNGEKLIKMRKEEIKQEVIRRVQTELNQYIDKANHALRDDDVGAEFNLKVLSISADFTGAIKNKRTMKSLNESANDELARAKIQVDSVYDRMAWHVSLYKDLAEKNKSDFPAGIGFLFPDMLTIIDYEEDSFTAVIKTRINEFKEAQKEKERVQQEQLEATDKVEEGSFNKNLDVILDGCEAPDAAVIEPSFSSVSKDSELYQGIVTDSMAENTKKVTAFSAEGLLSAIDGWARGNRISPASKAQLIEILNFHNVL